MKKIIKIVIIVIISMGTIETIVHKMMKRNLAAFHRLLNIIILLYLNTIQ